MHEAHGAADTACVLLDGKSEIAAVPDRVTAKTAAAATDAAEAAEVDRTSLRLRACALNPVVGTGHAVTESWNTSLRAAISRVHDRHAAQPRR
jgi:hypothetical protein